MLEQFAIKRSLLLVRLETTLSLNSGDNVDLVQDALILL